MSDMDCKKESEQEQRANQRQVGGKHYKMPGHEEHWDRAWRLKYDPFQYIITKWIERWREKGGVEDLKKVQHAIAKYIELVETGSGLTAAQPWFNPPDEDRKLFGPMSAGGGGGSMGPGRVETITYDPSGAFMHAAAVKQTGYTGFSYEGGTAEWDLFTCKKCRQEVRVHPNEAPGPLHTCIPSLNPELGQSK